MIFNKNQSAFASDWHREIWWWAVGIVPPSDSLTAAVKEKCSKDVLDGCEQWHGYFNALCEDMYTHGNLYAPASARQYRDILENIAANGALENNKIIWDNSANKFFDTLAAGKPILINHKGWQADLIEKENIGYVLPPFLNENVVRDFVNYVKNDDLLKKQGENAKKIAINQFSLEVAVEKYMKVFSYFN